MRLHTKIFAFQIQLMEFVAQLAERQVVALVVVGSIPIKLPNASIVYWLCSPFEVPTKKRPHFLASAEKRSFYADSAVVSSCILLYKV